MSTPHEIIDRALRVTGLSLGELAAQIGLKEATLYKARGGHIALSVPARKAIGLLTAARAGADPAAGALRSAKSVGGKAVPLAPLADQLAFIHQHATPEELKILAGTLDAFHRQIAARRRAS